MAETNTESKEEREASRRARQKALAQEAKQSLRRFESERRRERLRYTVSFSLVGAAALLLVMVVSGGAAFDAVLNAVGLPSLYNQEGGIFANCSLPENRDNDLCYPKQSVRGGSFGPAGNGKGGFTLNGR